ncbi:selenoprotein BthD [Stomoxys calcitrans]|uniref:selenoprotein BthD n=1 Tax=Stomoxys calcitrans TaxID=35570 RepID=UPI0027E21F64|nr:selenoprotein BthD [Stomoxys calcitrans]
MPKIKSKKGQREVDWSSDVHFQKTRSIVYIEHTHECPIFAIKAEEFLKFLQSQISTRQFVLIRNGYGKIEPRPGSFEIEFSQNARTSRHNLWSGLDKGPPRRDKFPNFESLMPAIHKILKKFYPDVVQRGEDD